MTVNRVPDWNAIQAREIAELQRLGSGIGFGRCIQILEQLWSEHLQRTEHYDRRTADVFAGSVCVWCNTDRRTGKINKED